MRTLSSLLFLGLVSTSGCKWTDFDDLASETWVHTTEKPNTSSADFGVALARGARSSASGGTVVAFGTSDPQYFELNFAANGDAQVAAVVLSQVASVTSLNQPVVLEDPATDEIAIIAPNTTGGVSVMHGAGGLSGHTVQGVTQVDAAAYVTVVPPMGRMIASPLVAAGGVVYGSYYSDNAMGLGPSMCALQDAGGNPIQIRGLAAARISSTTVDDVIVWGTINTGSQGKLLIYPNSIFDGCATPVSATAELATPFAPSIGSELIMVDATHVLLVGRKEITQTDAFLALYDVSGNAGTPQAPTAVGAAVTMLGLRTATILDLGTQKYVLAGYPNEVIDGVKAGRVLAFPLSLTTGLGDVPAMVLHDAQPEDDQAFGRDVAVTSYNGKPVIAVAADNEVFTYFRTPLYDETRQ